MSANQYDLIREFCMWMVIMKHILITLELNTIQKKLTYSETTKLSQQIFTEYKQMIQ